MTKNKDELLKIIKNNGNIKTIDIVQKADMCKVTALKYLKNLKKTGQVDYQLIGPTKLWHTVEKKGKDSGGRGLLTKVDSKISELLETFESITGKKAVIIMTVDDYSKTSKAKDMQVGKGDLELFGNYSRSKISVFQMDGGN